RSETRCRDDRMNRCISSVCSDRRTDERQRHKKPSQEAHHHPFLKQSVGTTIALAFLAITLALKSLPLAATFGEKPDFSMNAVASVPLIAKFTFCVELSSIRAAITP